MSKFHEAIRQLLEDVQKFLVTTLNTEMLTATALSHKESLLIKLHHLRIEYPQLQLSCISNTVPEQHAISLHTSVNLHNKRLSTGSPPPYIDMQGRSGVVGPRFSSHSTDYVLSDNSTDYEVYEDELLTTTASESLMSGTRISQMSEDSHACEASSDKPTEEVPASDLAKAEKSGYLEKKGRERLGGFLSPFQKRWCAIKDGIFYYYERPTDRRQKGQIDLTGYEARLTPAAIKDTNKKDLCFEIVCPGKRTYQFIAITLKDLKQWITAIERSSQRHKHVYGANGSFLAELTEAVQSNSGSSGSDEVVDVKEQVTNWTPCSRFRKPSSDQESIYETLDDHGAEQDDEAIYDEGESMLYNDDEELYMDAESIMDSHQKQDEKQEEEDFNPAEWYTGLWSCTSDNKTELSFVRGDLIKIISKEYDSHAWWVGELNGKIGLVPKSYLMEAYELVQ